MVNLLEVKMTHLKIQLKIVKNYNYMQNLTENQIQVFGISSKAKIYGFIEIKVRTEGLNLKIW